MENPQTTNNNHHHPKRPFSVTFLTWVVLIITSLNWLQLVEVIRRWEFLRSLDPAPPVIYLAITGLVWGLLGICLVWGLFLGRSWAPWLMQVISVIYTAYYWLDRLFFADFSAIANRWSFTLGLTITLLVFIFWLFSRPKTKEFFNQSQS